MTAISATVAGRRLAVTAFRVASGGPGAVGCAEIETGHGALRDAGIDIPALAAQLPAGIETAVAVTLDDGTRTRIFGGELVRTAWDYDCDRVTLEARDWAGALVDRACPLLAGGAPGAAGRSAGAALFGSAARSHTVSQLVTAIARQFSLTPVVAVPAGEDRVLGGIFGGADAALTPMPEALWGLLCFLARETGTDVHVTPDRELVFGPAAARPLLRLVHGRGPVPPGAQAIRQLRVTHNVRGSASFRVLVQSYDAAAYAPTEGRCTAIGTNLGRLDMTTGHPGLWPGATALPLARLLADAGVALPVYTFRIDGLTAPEAQARATAIATDIARRELVLTGTCDIIPSIAPRQHLRIEGETARDFGAHDYCVTAYRHVFTPPHPGMNGGSLVTEITASDVQSDGGAAAIAEPAAARA